MDMKTALNKSQENGHVPGIIFSTNVCFCKKCHAPLTYIGSIKNRDCNCHTHYGVDGLYGSKCNG